MPADQTMFPQSPEQTWMPRAINATSRPMAQFLGPTAALAGGAGTSSCWTQAAELGENSVAGLEAITLPISFLQPGEHQDFPRQAPQWPQPATVSLSLQMPASVLLQPPCQAWQESPQADTSLSKGQARAWLCVPVCDTSLVSPQHQPPVTPARALSPAPTQGAWHARRSRAGQQAPPDLREQHGQQHTRCAGGCRWAPGARTSRVSSPARAVGSEVSRPRRAELFC